jgi:predicted regulator of amino acid metabolism with ACT domain
MWGEIEERFKGYPAQKRVAKYLLGKGFRIGKRKRVMCGGIEIAHTQIGREVGVDRRVVDATVGRITGNKKLMKMYSNLESVAFLRNAAPAMGLGVIVISVDDASKSGVIGTIASKIANHGVSIRQAMADDPYLSENPEFTVITDGKIKGALLEDLKNIKGVKKITVY